MNTQATVTPATINDTLPIASTVEIKIDFGSGKYSKAMSFCFDKGIQFLSMNTKTAELFARRIGSQLGVMFKNSSSQADVKFGKTNKTGTLSVAEAFKNTAKGQEATPELQLARALQWWDAAGANGWSYSNSKLVLKEELILAVNALTIDAAKSK